MSRDIRSFFQPKKIQQPKAEADDDVIPESPDVQIKTRKQENKKRRVLNDDSDEEIFSTKKKKEANKSETSNKSKKPAKSTLKEVKPLDLFGSGPIKRTEPLVKKKVKTETGIHSDDEFEKSLLEIDNAELELQANESNTLNSTSKPSCSNENDSIAEKSSTLPQNSSNNVSHVKLDKPAFCTESLPSSRTSTNEDKNDKKHKHSHHSTSTKETLKSVKISNHTEAVDSSGDKKSKLDNSKRKFSEFLEIDSSLAQRSSKKTKVNDNHEESKVESTKSNDHAHNESKKISEKGNEHNLSVTEVDDTPNNKKRKLNKSLNDSVLTDEERHERRIASAALYKSYLNRSGPKHLGAKEIPEGTPDCLKDCAFLLTGVLDSFEKDEIIAAINKYGGCVKSGVTKKVTHVIAGEDAGPAKMAKAQELGITIINEDDFLQMITTRSKKKSDNHERKKEITIDSSPHKSGRKDRDKSSTKDKDKDKPRTKDNDKKITKDNDKSDVKDKDKDKSSSKHKDRDKSSPKDKDKSSPKDKDKSSPKDNKSKKDSTDKNKTESKSKVERDSTSKCKLDAHESKHRDKSKSPKKAKEELKADPTCEKKSDAQDAKPSLINDNNVPLNASMWVEKYKPQNVKQIIGQHGDASNVKKLVNWLTKWYVNRKSKISKPSPWAKNDDGGYYKAALLSGPPGVGKTTTVSLVCAELGFDMVEFNASDTRNKSLIKEQIGELLTTTSLSGYAKGETGKQAVTKKHVLVMDEVDGMAGNEDRGGLQELIALIKSASVPIICICNDRNSQKMRSLVNYCYDLRFNRPRVDQIKSAMMSICFKEGIKIPPDVLSQLIVSANQDVRQTLNLLSMWAIDPTRADAETLRKDARVTKKDVKLGPWEAIRKVFSAEEHKTMSINDMSDLFFYDYSLAPLFVQENYLQVAPHCDKREVLQRLSKAADSISMGDLVDARIRGAQAWNLLPLQAMYASVIPGHELSGHMTGQIQFPAWLGKNSRATKMRRLCQEIHAHTRLSTSGSKSSIFLDYASHIRDAIINPLINDRTDGITQSLEVLESYHLLREDLESLVELSVWPGQRNPTILIDSKVKAAMTRTYNKQASALPYAPGAVRRGRARPDDDDDELAEDEQEEEEPADSDPENDALIKKKKTKDVDKPGPSKEKTSSKPSTGKKKKEK